MKRIRTKEKIELECSQCKSKIRINVCQLKYQAKLDKTTFFCNKDCKKEYMKNHLVCNCCGVKFTRYTAPNRTTKTKRFYCSRGCKWKDAKSQYTLTPNRLKVLKGGLQRGTMSEYRRGKLEECGRYIPRKNKSQWEIYKLEVRRVTKKQQVNKLPNSEKRGHVKIKGAFHLDHIYSIKQGFIDGIPPEIIGNIVNLRFISWRKNLSKLDGCDITKDKLIEMYEGLES